MPSVSKKQQKFMGIVRAIQKGDQPAGKFSKDARDAAKKMKKKDVKKFAKTKHDGLPTKVRQEIEEYVDGIIDGIGEQFMVNEEQCMCEACQKGYMTHPTRKTKEMFGKRYRNCIKAEDKINERMDKRKAAVLLKQLGGNRFIAMTGAKGFAVSNKYMSFKIGRNSKGINFVRIGHNAKDLYDMEFGFVSVRGIKVKKKVKDVYADMLGQMFKKHTGMNVRL